ncbi:MAG: ADP-ribosylglycohydrolase family protein [Accumulibacter sp.]
MNNDRLNDTFKTKEDLKEVYGYLVENKFLKKDLFPYEHSLLKEFIAESQIEEKPDILLEKIRGTFIGLAVGDALGRYLEGLATDLIYLEEYASEDFDKPGVGFISDDTQLTMGLSFSIIDKGGLNPNHIAGIYAHTKIVGPGKATLDALKKYKQSTPWYACGTVSAGNGVAMRSSPIGIYYRDEYEALRLASMLQAIITHNDPMVIASGIVTALAVRLTINMKSGYLDTLENKIKFLKALAESIKGIEDGEDYRTRNTKETDTLYNRINFTIPDMLKKNITLNEADRIFWSGAYVLESLPFALFAFLRTPSEFNKVLLDGVNFSHDSDTVGAIACGLAGAYNGRGVIDSKFTDTLERRDDIEKMAEKMSKVKYQA